MYPVSEEYKKAISESSRSFFWTGEITTKQGKIYAFDNKDIVKGSGYILSLIHISEPTRPY